MTQVAIDLEAIVLEDLHSWQKDLINRTAGFKAGEMMVISAGRQTGKSYYQQYMTNFLAELHSPAYEQIGEGVVDGDLWLTVKCNKETAAWVRGQNKKYVYEHSTSRPLAMFDVHEKLYTMLKIKFTP